LLPFLRAAGVRSRTDLGLGSCDNVVAQLARGFLIGFASLACVAVLAIAAGTRTLESHNLLALLGKIVGSMATAVVVAMLEETLFRGALMAALRNAFNWPMALFVSSLIYAMLHFFHRPPQPDHIGWQTGLAALSQMLRGFMDWHEMVPSLLNLFIVGMILGLVRRSTGSLYMSIGLHAGWIFWLKLFGAITHQNRHDLAWLWGTRKMIDGWVTSGVLLITLAIIIKMYGSAPGRNSAAGCEVSDALPNDR
jgi:uncharacterized protein